MTGSEERGLAGLAAGSSTLAEQPLHSTPSPSAHNVQTILGRTLSELADALPRGQLFTCIARFGAGELACVGAVIQSSIRCRVSASLATRRLAVPVLSGLSYSITTFCPGKAAPGTFKSSMLPRSAVAVVPSV